LIDEKILTTESDPRVISKIITKYNDSIYYTIIKNVSLGWQEKFKRDGVKIKIGSYDAYRLFSGRQILFYIPELNIQIDYWGDKKDIHLFYTIINTIKKDNTLLIENKTMIKVIIIKKI